jgi:hypothetical protein
MLVSRTLAAFAVVAGLVVAPASASPICLKTYLIDRTNVVDPTTIDFRMRDGTIYRNRLLTSCPGLRFDGFSYVVTTDEVCDNLQSIRVLRTHSVCLLGAFTKIVPKATPTTN